MSVRSRSLVLSLVVGLVVAACSPDAGASTRPSPACSTQPSATACGLPTSGTSGEPSVAPSTAPSGEPTALTVGLGFIPSVQFAPFYHADRAGLYEAAGLDVTFQNKIDPDLITLVGQGAVDIGLGDGTSVIPAVSQGIPIQYVATVYGRFPSIVFAKASSGIATVADLSGKRLGIPGRYGSSWIAVQAMLASADLTPDDLEIVEYPDFGQGAAVIAGAVDAATGFVNNEPVQLELTGETAIVLHVDDVVPLPGNGLIVGTATKAAKADAIRAFVAVTLDAMEAIEADPKLGLDATFAAVPELATGDPAVQDAILRATIDAWRGPAQQQAGLGAIRVDDWEASIEYMVSLGLVADPVTADELVDLTFLPAGD